MMGTFMPLQLIKIEVNTNMICIIKRNCQRLQDSNTEETNLVYGPEK